MRLYRPATETIKAQKAALLHQLCVSHQIRDVLLRLGNIEQHLVIDTHLQTQVVVGRVDLVSLTPVKEQKNTC